MCRENSRRVPLPEQPIRSEYAGKNAHLGSGIKATKDIIEHIKVPSGKKRTRERL